MERLQGVVAVWLPLRGFGFLVVDQGKDVERFFYHISHVSNVDKIAVGMRATFNVNPIRQGKNYEAVEVEILDANGGAL